MTGASGKHAFTDWARRRLDEMDAALTAMEAKSEALQGQAQEQAAGALAEMRRCREDFDGKVNAAMSEGESAWDTMKGQMESAWGKYEAGFGQWVEAARSQGEAFEARSKAQLGVWQSMLEEYGKRAEAAGAEQRQTLEAEVARWGSTPRRRRRSSRKPALPAGRP